MYTIGDFSRITGITAKALRHYHEIGLLVPSKKDELTNYRFYSEKQIEVTVMIVELKEFGFSLDDIKAILQKMSQDKEVLRVLAEQKEKIQEEIKSYNQKFKRLEQILKERNNFSMKNIDFNIQEKEIPDLLIASIRHKGRYKEVGGLFSKLGRACGFQIAGAPFTLHYDTEYKEEDADFEAAMPIKSSFEKEGITVRKLIGGKAITVMHKGPYDAIGSAYKKLIDYINSKKLKISRPSREVYLKGPSFLFNNPKNYITEIQFLPIL